VRSVLEAVGTPTLASAEVERVDEAGDTGCDLDGTPAGIVEDAKIVGPSVGVPDIVCDDVVNDGGPAEDEWNDREDTASLACSTDGDGGHEGCELLLIDGEDDGGELVVGGADGSLEDTHEAKVLEVADERASAI